MKSSGKRMMWGLVTLAILAAVGIVVTPQRAEAVFWHCNGYNLVTEGCKGWCFGGSCTEVTRTTMETYTSPGGGTVTTLNVEFFIGVNDAKDPTAKGEVASVFILME